MTRIPLLTALTEKILLCDGGTGSRVQAMDLQIDRDYWGQENCTEILNLSRPDIVREIHRGYLDAGSDIVQTNSFGGSPITLGEFDLADRALEINRIAAEIARAAVADAESADPNRPRYVLGSIGPGTRLPSLGQIDYDRLEPAYEIQAMGLMSGGVDGILIETCQDLLQIKAAVNGAKNAREKLNKTQENLPIFVQVTIETTGSMLVGSDIAAAATVIRSLDIPMMGLNCATGPQEMAEHVRWIAENWDGMISVQPNAGLPELIDGKTVYPLIGQELSAWLQRFINDYGINLIGGCCGTSIPHITALDVMLRQLATEQGAHGQNPSHRPSHRPAPKIRSNPAWVPSLASIYGQVPLRQENAFFSIGERCNANGSRQFKRMQEAGDWNGCVEMGREQVREGSNAIDVCTAFVGRDEVADMTQMIARMSNTINAPLVIDSTELRVIEAALKLYGGKSVINSINFEDGEEPAAARLKLAKKFGAAMVALTIDEKGMAKDVDGKIAIAHRLARFAHDQFKLPYSDLLIDPLTFTICTGNEDDRELGLHTLNAIEIMAKDKILHECQIVLGLSNISFGLNPAARHVLNSVFLDHALQRGMTGAILHHSKIMPLHKIPTSEREAAEALIYNQPKNGGDPLQDFIALFEGRNAEAAVKRVRHEAVEDRLKQRIIDGDRVGLDDDLQLAMGKHKPLDIINSILLDGMKVVGELFGSGKMQLPFVLQSAETMKAAVAWLEPYMERVEGQQKGTIVLATVKGDVHDIGKNLVDIILTNNGYRVVNLGIKQPIAAILDAAKTHKADAIGMSGLLVKSTVVMRENLEEMTRTGLGVPVLLGGAALTRKYVEEECSRAYGSGQVAYARDAFDGLSLMEKVVGGEFEQLIAARAADRAKKPTNTKRVLGQAAAAQRPVDYDEIRLRRHEMTRNVPVPTPPFWGARMIEAMPVKALVPFLNQNTLFQFQWGFKKAGKTLAEFQAYAKTEIQPIFNRMIKIATDEDIIKPQAIYGYWKAAASGNDLVIFEENGRDEIARFALPRQAGENGLCIADFFRDIGDGSDRRDVLGLQLVTMGRRVSEIAAAWFGDNRYQDYLYLHGIGVELAEAMAEYVHKRIRAELGFASEEGADMAALLKQHYRGSRYSFGYPACPNLGDQRILLRLLGAERIGLVLTEEDQLEPEQSTSAIVVHHPEAKYFSV
ncbi:MAG: methionine synthase [Candidatus Symbiobacter sp.]|nr:methionine synthase [Candidatus Symbiobacter sp.]